MRIQRAIILAAGKGERLRPLTLETPKPLIKVNGVRMIESVITALRRNGISEIYVVVGYLKEQFSFLPQKYPGLELIENPWYKEANNISSLYAARAHIEDCFIMDGDQIIHDPDVLCPEFTRSGYHVTWSEQETKEWLLEVEDGIVSSCSRTGGAKGYQLYSVSRWSAEDGKKLAAHAAEAFESGNRDIYWDDLPLFVYPEAYRLGIYQMNKDAVQEIDSLEELIAADSSYGGVL